jgi:hypothetical protein
MAAAHPDRNGGDDSLFLFLTAVREHVEGCRQPPVEVHLGPNGAGRVPFDEQLGHPDEFVNLTLRALSIAERAENPFSGVLRLLLDCCPPAHGPGRRALRQCRGATYKQLAYIGHLVGMNSAERVRFYELSRSVPLSEAHAAHIIDSLKEQAAA